jgi:hypothetical protein
VGRRSPPLGGLAGTLWGPGGSSCPGPVQRGQWTGQDLSRAKGFGDLAYLWEVQVRKGWTEGDMGAQGAMGLWARMGTILTEGHRWRIAPPAKVSPQATSGDRRCPEVTVGPTGVLR